MDNQKSYTFSIFLNFHSILQLIHTLLYSDFVDGKEVRLTNFPNKKFSSIAHVRPHAKNANDTYPLPKEDSLAVQIMILPFQSLFLVKNFHHSLRCHKS